MELLDNAENRPTDGEYSTDENVIGANDSFQL